MHYNIIVLDAIQKANFEDVVEYQQELEGKVDRYYSYHAPPIHQSHFLRQNPVCEECHVEKLQLGYKLLKHEPPI